MRVIAVLALVAIALAYPQIVWPSKYYLEGEFILPYANITQSITVNYDEDNHCEKLSFFDDLNYTIWNGADYSYVRVEKDHPVCLTEMPEEASRDEDMTPLTPVLPDISNWNYQGTKTVRGIKVYHYSMIEVDGEGNNQKTNNYDMFVGMDRAPVRFEIRGYDSVFGSHFDLYTLEYYTFVANYNQEGVYDRPMLCSAPSLRSNNVGESPMLADLRQIHPRNVAARFGSFEQRYNRSYASETERVRRQGIFARNLDRINELNSRNLGWTASVNRYADMEHHEILAARTGFVRNPLRDEEDAPETCKYNGEDLPVSIDWRVKGAVGPVKDQAACGSCWTFGTMGTVEGRWFIGHNEHQRFSEQGIVDCFWDDSDNGCEGGDSVAALKFLYEKQALPLESEYPYIGLDDYCQDHLYKASMKIDSYGRVEAESVDSLKLALQDGPVAIAISVPESMIWYSYGVYYDEECSPAYEDLGHAVTAVGYGVDPDFGEYWIVKNSWSSFWGDNGYIYISTVDNNCGCATDAGYAVINKA
ncbi:peptidase C1A [Kipferlia bialata]|uniref:Peptidase C1A n=1 Tax=Kipferlia bialata TaxID=797122 RepID=A0A9K3CVG6_9EUKA|nr:peptidase C1A [Kipferlia bialata]|eukprot:g4457.t1